MIDDTRGTTASRRRRDGKTAPVAALVACHLLGHPRPGTQLGLRIFLVLSTIRLFLCSSRWRDGFDYCVLRRHCTSCSSLDWGKSADSLSNIRICASRPGCHCLEVRSTSVSAVRFLPVIKMNTARKTSQLLVNAVTVQMNFAFSDYATNQALTC